MSRHYIDVVTSAFAGAIVDVSALLTELAKTHPELAARFAALDFAKLRQSITVAAMQRAAKRLGVEFRTTFENAAPGGYQARDGGIPEGMTCLGVLYGGAYTELGVAMGEKGEQLFFNNSYAQLVSKELLATWKQEVEKSYREVTIETYLTLSNLDAASFRVEGATIVVGTKKVSGT